MARPARPAAITGNAIAAQILIGLPVGLLLVIAIDWVTAGPGPLAIFLGI